MTRSAFPWTSPTRRFSCASAIRRGSLMWYRPKTCRLFFHGSAPSALPRASYRALAARDDRPGVAHALAGRCGEPGDIGHHGLAHELSDVLSGRLLVAAADFADEDDPLGARIALEELEHVDEVHAAHRIAADAH